MSTPTVERHRDFDRFLTFIDAIVAIAITLLVLPLVELATDFSGSVAKLIGDHNAELWSFLLSFVVIARLWFVQHGVVRPVMFMDRAVTRWLMVWSMTIVFLPFPTALVAKVGSQWLTKVLYIGTIEVSIVALVALEIAVAARPRIRPGADASDPSLGVVNVILVTLALALSLAVPATSYYPMLLLMLDDPLRRLYRRLRHLPAS
ncbi:MAG: TMEM175 family protein [Nakamurella sp.]